HGWQSQSSGLHSPWLGGHQRNRMNVKFKASARTTALHRTGAGRQRNPTAPVGGEVFSLDIPFHRTDETHYFAKLGARVRVRPAPSTCQPFPRLRPAFADAGAVAII